MNTFKKSAESVLRKMNEDSAAKKVKDEAIAICRRAIRDLTFFPPKGTTQTQRNTWIFEEQAEIAELLK